MGEYFPEQKSLAGRVNVEFAEYVDLPHLKSNVDKFDTEKRSN